MTETELYDKEQPLNCVLKYLLLVKGCFLVIQCYYNIIFKANIISFCSLILLLKIKNKNKNWSSCLNKMLYPSDYKIISSFGYKITKIII